MMELDDILCLRAASALPTETENLPIPFDRSVIEEFGLRFYQLQVLHAVIDLIALGYRRILIVMPTGAGKTRWAAAFMSAVLRARGSASFLVHRRELIRQSALTFTEFGLNPGQIVAGVRQVITNRMTVASVQTLVRRLEQYSAPSVVIADECHHAIATTWTTIMDAWGNSIQIGLTATPERLDGKPLGDCYDAMVVGPSTSQLIEWEFLSPFDYYAPEIPDMSSVKRRAGDLAPEQQEPLMNRPELVGSAVEHYKRLGGGRQGIFFATSVKHSLALTQAFCEAGVPAVHVDCTRTDERDENMARYAARDARVLCNVNLVSEGVDIPATKYVGLCRASDSLTFFWQACGRALRPDPAFDRAIICDHAGNAIRQGCLPDSDVHWSLDAPVKKSKGKSSATGDLPVWQCGECFRVNYSTSNECSGCGAPKPQQAREVKEVDGKLTKLEKEQLKKLEAEKRKNEEAFCRNYADFYQLAVSRQYKNPAGWARVRAKFRPITKVR